MFHHPGNMLKLIFDVKKRKNTLKIDFKRILSRTF